MSDVAAGVNPARHLALKIDVDTLRGTLEGVPRLLDLFDRHDIAATFLYSLGPDHTGRALKRAFRPGFFAKVQRTSVIEHYGLKTLLYGTLLPGPDIGKLGADVMRESAKRGHETGIHTWDHVLWQDHVRHRPARWTWRQMVASHDRYLDIFGKPPVTHGAAGWQINDDALRQLDTWGMRYASDGRVADDESDRGAFRPFVGGRTLGCVQIPTTLPTLDELIGIDDRDALDAAEVLLARTASSTGDEVFTLHAELEGMKLIDAFEHLVVGWKRQGFALGSMATAFERVDLDRLPLRRWGWGAIAGRSGELMITGERVVG
jgi:peptidoglycan/xylan/chitin deacetylase (PgdA/CDA1 family)